MSQHQTVRWCVALGGLVLLAGAGQLWWPGTAQRAGPRSFDQAIAVADALGLYHGTDQAAGPPIGRLIISEMPVSRERAGLARINQPQHTCWTGTVALYEASHSLLNNYDPHCSVYWGSFFVYGDPVLIERLTGIRPEAY